MARKHTLIAALALGLAAILGVVALGRTLGLGAASSNTSGAVIAKRTHQLDRFEAALRKQLKAAPSVPAVAPPAAPGAQRVLYVRPKPIVVTVHRAHSGDDRYEALSGHDGGGEADD